MYINNDNKEQHNWRQKTGSADTFDNIILYEYNNIPQLFKRSTRYFKKSLVGI